MKTLLVTQLKPNPAGKDRTRYGGATPAQLGAEWVDFKNTGGIGIDLGSVELHHVAFGNGKRTWRLVTNFKGELGPGKIVRVHAGQQRDLSVLRQEDLLGADHHLFSGEDQCVWNNAEGDTAGLWDSSAKQWIDQASYDPYPPEGIILVRVGDKLVALTTATLSTLLGRRS